MTFSDLEETLLLLPYTSACELLPLLKPLLKRTLHGDLVCRLLVFLIKVHHRPISATPSLQPLIAELSQLALARAQELRVSSFSTSFCCFFSGRVCWLRKNLQDLFLLLTLEVLVHNSGVQSVFGRHVL